MAIAVDAKCLKEVILKSDRGLPRSKQTVFLMRPMLQSELAQFHDVFMKGGETDVSYSDVLDYIGKFLRGWRNFKTEADEQVVYDPGAAERNLDRLDVSQLQELMEGLIALNKIEGVELENLSLER